MIRSLLRNYLLNPLALGKIVAHLPQFLLLFYRLLRDNRVPLLTRMVPVLGLLLLIFPPNLEVEMIPMLGELDALVIILLTLKLFVWLCPPDVVREHVGRISHAA